MRHDPTLIESARQGNFAAMERLRALCRPDLLRIARSQCSGGVDPDDAVQESWLLIYRRIGTLRTAGAFPAWMFSIVRRECNRLWRATRSQVALPEPNHPICAYHEHTGLRADLVAAIQSLPDKYREAIVLRDFEEYSITETADALRLTRAAVKSRIHRGRQMIREYLAD